MASTTALPPSRADPAAGWRGRTLARLVEDVRALLPVDAVALVAVDEDRRFIERAAGWFATPELHDALAPIERQPLDRGRRGLVEAALERDRPLLLPRVEAWEASQDLHASTLETLGEERGRRAWRSFRKASVIALQLRAEIGRPLGVIVLASLDRRRPLSAGDLRSVEVVADLAAMALERAGLLEAEAGRARDELRLKRATEAVSGSLELDEVYRRVAEHAAHVTGATRALLTRLDSRGTELRAAASLGFSTALTTQRLSVEASAPGQVARTRAVVLARRADADEPNRRLMEDEAIGAVMHAPIELGSRVYGVLSVAHEDPDHFGADDLELLVQLARSSAAAIANAIDFERERRIARALTLGFVPESIPEVEGYETGLLYAPAADEPTGGDVYGVWRLPGGDVAMLVGDVAGKGVETAALSAMVRFFIEARSWDAPSPALVLSRANTMLIDRLPSDTFVTAFLGVLSPDSLRYCNAGHLPPLLISGEGHRTLADHCLPVGVDETPEYHDTELRLVGGDLLFAYTDGLVEARHAGEIYGHERLARLVAGWASTLAPRLLAHAVHEEIAAWADGLNDDAVALALRRRP